MTRLFFVILALCGWMSAMADNVVFIDDFEMNPDEEKWVEVKMQNTDLIANLQLSLVLPLGLHVTTVSCGDYLGISLPNRWNDEAGKDAGSSWEVLTNKSDDLYNILLISGIARYKNENGVISDFGIESPAQAVPIMKIRLYADESFKSGNINFVNCLAASVRQLSIPVDGLYTSVYEPTDISIPTAINGVTDETPMAADTYYNIAGQKVSEGNNGVVIKDGKTIIKR